MVWDGPWTLGVLAAVALPAFLAPLLAPEGNPVTQVAGLGAVVAYVAVLFADLLIYLHWRMTGGPANWLVLALTALSIQGLAVAGLVATDPLRSEGHSTRIVFVQGLVAVGLFTLVAIAKRRRLRMDPIIAGGILGLAVGGVRYLLVNYTGPMHTSRTTVQILNVTVLLLDLAIAAAVLRLTIAPAWVRMRVACAMVLLSIGHAATYPAPSGTFLSIVSVSTNLLGATVLLALSITLVRLSWLDNRAALDLLGYRLEQVEAGARIEQARLHEIRATVAGLRNASRLIHQRSAINGDRRRQLEDMMEAEMGRLQRILNDETAGAPELVDLDETIRPIVTRHRALGYPIRWVPSGEQAMARADDVAEVVSVLLQNAVHHAPGAGASIVTRRVEGGVEVAISDTGPGVERAVRSKIFEWGERGRASGGSGIGLNVARQLTTDLGGYLKLVESSAPGATFVLGLPSEDVS